MGLKTDKSSKTTRLNCQYVGSFLVKDGDRKLKTSEQKKFVEEKLKSCKKKLMSGMPVVLEVSPDGVKVLASDEKTAKMGHSLRRISYATAEANNKLFAYVSHQPGTDMEVVCHTFLTKKKDHAQGLSATLGKLFKQTFAYTLKRRDKLEEAAEKRGANRRWAKQQVAEGHSVSEHAMNAARHARVRPNAVDNAQQQETVSPSQSAPTTHVRSRTPSSPEADIPSSPLRPNNAGDDPRLPPKRNEFSFPENQTVGSTRTGASTLPGTQYREGISPLSPRRNEITSSQNQFGTATCTSPVSLHRTDQVNDGPPPLPKRREKKFPRHESTGSIEAHLLQNPGEIRSQRKHSAPPDIVSSFPTHAMAKPRRSSSYTEEVSPTWLKTSDESRELQMAASALLAGVGNIPPPLPRRHWEATERRGSEATTIPEQEAFDHNGNGKRQDTLDRRASFTLEDEDWYIPGVSREMVTEMLESSDIGTFFVRDSQSRPGCYALTMKVLKGPNNPTGFGNYLIMPVENGFALQGFEKVFEDIFSLIRHYAAHEDGLPCCLVLAGSNPLFHDANGYLAEFMDEEDAMYDSLSNCTSMFQELKMRGNDVPW